MISNSGLKTRRKIDGEIFDVEEELSKKLDVWNRDDYSDTFLDDVGGVVYGHNSHNNANTVYRIGKQSKAPVGSIPVREPIEMPDGFGAPMSTGTPLLDRHATNKKYVDDIIQNKVNTTDIVNDLASQDVSKPLSAAMGKSLLEIAEGKTNSFTFDTEELFNIALADWNNPVSNPGWYEITLKNGDIALIVELDKPDRWYNEHNNKWEILETAKVDLEAYQSKEETEIQLAAKLDKTTTSSPYVRVYAITSAGSQAILNVAPNEALINSVVRRTGTAGTDGLGAPMFTGTPTADGHAANKKYVDESIPVMQVQGDTLYITIP